MTPPAHAPTSDTRRVVSEIVATAARLTGGAALAPDMPLLGAERSIDSLAILEIIVAVEERLGVQLSADDVTPETFGTLDRLVRLVESRRAT